MCVGDTEKVVADADVDFAKHLRKHVAVAFGTAHTSARICGRQPSGDPVLAVDVCRIDADKPAARREAGRADFC